MKISRRKFLVAAPLVAGAILQLNGSAIGQQRDAAAKIRPPFIEPDALAKLNWDSFYQFINTDFTFGRGYNAVSLRLLDMTDSRPFSSSKRKMRMSENFVMKFQGPFNKVLTQGTYKVNHFNLGDFDLFITDGGRVGKEQYYVAVINRVVE
jgi:hypothetical protein